MPGRRTNDGVNWYDWTEEDVDPGGYYRNQGYTIDGNGNLQAPAGGAGGSGGSQDVWDNGVPKTGYWNGQPVQQDRNGASIPGTGAVFTNPGSDGGPLGTGGVGGPTGTGGTTSGPRAGDRDSLARLRQLFATYGLPSTLGDWAWGELQKGVGESEITLSLYDRPEFKTRFPALDARRAKNLPPITPAEYIAYEGARRQLMMSAGLPPGFYDDPADATDDIASDRSINEIANRIQTGFTAVKSAPVEVRDAFTRFFGADGDSALAAVALDQTRSLTALEKVVASSTAAGMGWRHNVRIDKAQAERLGDRGLSAQAYDQGFRQVAQLGSLYDESVGENTDFTAQGVGVDAAFGDVAAQDQLVGRINQRTNRSKQGTAGFGAASGDRGAYGTRQLT